MIERIHKPERRPYQSVALADIDLAYFEWGTSGPLVLLWHGFPDSAHTWDVIAPGIAAAGYRVVAPFLRGYAPSGIPSSDADARTLGRDVIALADALGGDDVRIVGHDWGAEAVYAAAALAPDRFRQMVAIAIPHRAAIRMTPSLLWSIRHFITLTLPGAETRFAANDYAMVEVLFRRWSPTWRHSPEDLELAKNELAAPGGLHAALGYYRAARLRTPDFLRAKVLVPTLCIAGADDPGVSPAVFEATRNHFPGGYEVVTVPGGHFCQRESPGPCTAAILRFLERGAR
jgi:pimeloyl-ACP methyl ester carboxylesterase